MTEKLRESGFLMLVVVTLLGGVALQAIVGDTTEGAAPRFAGDLVQSKAIFCAPSSAAEGRVSLALAPTSGDRVQVGIEPATPVELDRQQDVPAPQELDADQALITSEADNMPVDAVGYGGTVAGTSMLSSARPVAGVGAAACSGDVSARWFFAAGSTVLGADERILLYNPFPDEAVVRLNFYTPRGLETRTGVNDVPVRAGSWTSVAINEVIRAQGSVAVEVAATRGRVVAWREMFIRSDEGPRGVQLTLGATHSARDWYFADGAVGDGFDERISVLNPGDRRAVVEITLVTDRRALQPANLMDLTLPARTSASFALDDARTGLRGAAAGVGAIVRSRNRVGIVVERTVRYDSEDATGTTAELGLTQPGRRWLLGPAVAAPSADAIALLNPGAEVATVDILLLEERGQPLELGQLQNLEIKPSSRLKLPIEQITDGRPFLAVVTSDRPILAERWSYAANERDVSAVMGVRLRPTP